MPTRWRPCCSIANGRRNGFRVSAPARHGRGALHDGGARRPASTGAAASMRPWARTRTCWPIWCGACWRTAPTAPSSTRSSTTSVTGRRDRPRSLSRSVAKGFDDCGRQSRRSRHVPTEIFAPERPQLDGLGSHRPDHFGGTSGEDARPSFASSGLARQDRSSTESRAVAATEREALRNPARYEDVVGIVTRCRARRCRDKLFQRRRTGGGRLGHRKALSRSALRPLLPHRGSLRRANAPELMALAAREAGKTLAQTAVARGPRGLPTSARYLRASGGLRLEAEEPTAPRGGIFACISPWNFPPRHLHRPDRSPRSPPATRSSPSRRSRHRSSRHVRLL